jgi:hypothetical protein
VTAEFAPSPRSGVPGAGASEGSVKSLLGSSSGSRPSERVSAERKTNRPRLKSSALASRTSPQAKRIRARKRTYLVDTLITALG